MNDSQSRFEILKSKITNNPLVASLMIIGMIIVALSTFTDAAKNLLRLTMSESRPDINGEWIAEITYPGNKATHSEVFYFDGDSKDLYGSASYLEKEQVILEGKINQNLIDFKTKTMEYSPDWNSSQRIQATHQYHGRFSEKEITFIMETYGGFSANPPIKFMARKKPE